MEAIDRLLQEAMEMSLKTDEIGVMNGQEVVALQKVDHEETNDKEELEVINQLKIVSTDAEKIWVILLLIGALQILTTGDISRQQRKLSLLPIQQLNESV